MSYLYFIIQINSNQDNEPYWGQFHFICPRHISLPLQWQLHSANGGTSLQKKRVVTKLLSFYWNRRRPTLPGRVQPSTISAEGLNFCVRNENRWIPFAIITGMVKCASLHTHNCTVLSLSKYSKKLNITYSSVFWIRLRISLRPISIGKLNTLLCLHTRPIYLVVFKGSYQ